MAKGTFGIAYDDLDPERQSAVDDYYSIPISEAEPKNVGGN